MDKLKKTKELIGSHQNVLEHYVVDPDVNITVWTMFNVLLEEIERLEKELKRRSRKHSDNCLYNVKPILKCTCGFLNKH